MNDGQMVETANQDLVSKGRTMSIDQAIQHGIPRSLSVDSVDYTNMLKGEMDEATSERIRKTRKQNKHQPKLWEWREALTCRNYRSILKNSVPVSEALSPSSTAPVPTSAPVVPKKETKPAPKRGKKPQEKKLQEKKSKPKTEEDGWKTIEKKH